MSGPWENYKKGHVDIIPRKPWVKYTEQPAELPPGVNEADLPVGPMTPEMMAIEKRGIEANPWVDPVSALAGGFTGGMSGITGKVLPKLAGGIRGAVGSLITEPVTGQIAEKAGEIHPALSLPAAIATGLLTGKGWNKAMAPGQSKLIPGAEELFQKAKTEGLPLSPDIFTKSKFTKNVRRLADLPPFGSSVMNTQREKLNDVIMDMRNNFITDTLQMQKPGTAKGLFLKGTEVFKQARREGKELEFAMPNLKKFLDENIMDPDLKVSKQTHNVLMKAKKDLAENGVLKFEDINDIHAKEWGKYTKMEGWQKALHGKLKSALDADMGLVEKETNTKVFQLLKEGKNIYKDAYEAAKADKIEKMFKFSTKYDEVNQIYTFHPRLFRKQLDNNMKELEKTFKNDPEKLQMLEKFAQETEFAVTDIARYSKSLGKDDTWQKLGSIGAMLWHPWLAVPAGFSYFAAHAFMRPKSPLKKWLTIGWKSMQVPGKALPVAQAIKAGKFSIWQNEGDNEGE